MVRTGKTNRGSDVNSLRVVIADDDGLTLMVLRKILTSMGHEVVGESADGREAVAMTQSANPDLVILDIRMPQMDGLEAARLIQERRPTPVMILSAYSESGLGSKASDVGAHAYLVKPFTEAQIKPAIELALANFEKSMEMEQRLQKMNNALEARKLVERAKGILMRQTGIDEEDAYLKLQRTARNGNKKMADVAQAIIMAEELLRDNVKSASSRGSSQSS